MSSRVNDAGALAPVVFSGEEIPGTCKITRIQRKRRPCPPKSDLLNPLMVLVLTESACTGRFEAFQFGKPKNDISCFGRSNSIAIAQIGSLASHKHVRSIKIN